MTKSETRGRAALVLTVLALCVAAMYLAGTSAAADPVVLLSDDFETSFTGWTLTGTPDWYTGAPKNGTHSIRLRQTEAIQRTISTVGYGSITVSFYLGADGLSNTNEKVQALWYDGSAWAVLKEITDGDPEEDKQLHYFSYALPPSASSNAAFALRFAIIGKQGNDYAYLDDVVVQGELLQHTLSLTGANGQVKVNGTAEALPWSGTFSWGSVVTLEAAPDAGYEFGGWSGDLTGSESPTTITVDADKAIGAAFTQLQHTLSLTGSNGQVKVNGTPQPLPWSDSFSWGTVVTLEAVPEAGYEFGGWSGDLSGNESPTTITVDADKAIGAAFTQLQHTLSLTGSNGQVKVNGTAEALPWSGTFSWGSEVTLEAVPDAGYEFGGWSGDLTGNTNPTTITVDADKAIGAAFTQLQHTLSLTGANGQVKVNGTAQPLPWSGTFSWGTVVTLEAVPEAGYEFGGWSGDLSGNENPTAISIDSDKMVDVGFAENSVAYILALTGNRYGRVKVDGVERTLPWSGEFAVNSEVALEAVPDAGGEFDSWSGDLVGSENPTTILLDAAKAIDVRFLPPVIFPDVPREHWAFWEVTDCYYEGIVRGYPDGLYRPGGRVDRASMAVYISRALTGGDSNVPPGPPTATFPDVPTSYWAYRYVEYTVSKQIVKGYPGVQGQPAQYRPSLDVTRDQMAVFVARAIVDPTGDDGLSGYQPPEVATFADVAIGSWAYQYVEYIASQSITRGYPEGLYHPEFKCTRDQMAVYVSRAFELSE
jgi:allophanate hydrolase subunit 2